jgi:translocation and assembly module TamA
MDARPSRREAPPALSRPAALLAIVALSGPVACGHARGTFERPALTKLELRGVESVEKGDLEEKLATQGPTFWDRVLFWRSLPRLDRDALSVDRRRIEAYYRERGYYGARVESMNVVMQGDTKARVEVRVREGKPVRVEEVEVVGLDAAPEARARLAELPLRSGEIFAEDDYDATRTAILVALLETGWATAEVKQTARVLPEEGTATARYEVAPGPRYRFGSLFVAGTTTVPRDRIREQVAIEVKTGEPWRQSALAAAQARVFGLGVFGGVRVARGTPDPVRGTIPVVVTVREAPFRTIRAGPGFAIEATRWEARAVAGWTHRNAFGDLQRLSLDGRLGYAWLPTAYDAQDEGPVGQAQIEFYQPGAISRRIDLLGRFEVERGREPAYDFWSQKVRGALPVRLGRRWSFIPSYNLEYYHVAGDLAAGTDESELACRGDSCLLSYFEERLRWDGRDRPLDTRRGVAAGLALQQGFHVGLNGYQYVRVLPELEAYWSPSAHVTIATRLRFGALIPIDEPDAPPITARLFAGGPGSMRGFYTRRLAPYVQETDGDWVPVGGNGLLDGSVEVRFATAGNWSGATFVDLGNVSDFDAKPTTWHGALDLAQLHWAAGLGLRYSTPLGPFRIDGALRLPTDWSAGSWSDGVPRPQGLSEDTDESLWTVFISLGDSF